MKKIFLVLLMALTLCFTGVSIAYAEEEQGKQEIIQETIEEIPEEESFLSTIEEETARIVEWVIAGVVGLVGTTGVALLFRTQLTELISKIVNALATLKQNKELSEETITAIKDDAVKTLQSLEKVKDEITNLHKEEFEALREQIVLLEKTVCILATGMNEMIINGSAKSICDLVENKGFTVSENEEQEV